MTYQPNPPVPPRLLRTPVTVLLVIAAAAAVTAAVLTGVAVAGGGGVRPEACCPGAPPRAAPESSSSPSSPPTRPAGVPMCLVGTWQVVETVSSVRFFTDVARLPMTATGAQRYDFRPDGTATATDRNFTYSTSYRGQALRLVYNGVRDFRWSATDKRITYHALTRSTQTYQYLVDGQPRGSGATLPNANLNELDNYTCSATQVVEWNSTLGYRATWVRTTASGVYG